MCVRDVEGVMFALRLNEYFCSAIMLICTLQLDAILSYVVVIMYESARC